MKREGYIEIEKGVNMCNSRVRYVITSKGRRVLKMISPHHFHPTNRVSPSDSEGTEGFKMISPHHSHPTNRVSPSDSDVLNLLALPNIEVPGGVPYDYGHSWENVTLGGNGTILELIE